MNPHPHDGYFIWMYFASAMLPPSVPGATLIFDPELGTYTIAPPAIIGIE
jgi:hypothetical protein